MAIQNLTVRLQAQDETAAAFSQIERATQRATSSATAYGREVQRAAAGDHAAFGRSIQLRRDMEAANIRLGRTLSTALARPGVDAQVLNAAIAASAQAHQRATQAARQHGSALNNIGGELVGLAASYLSVGAAIEGARNAFFAFAEQDKVLRGIQIQSGATRAQLDQLSRAALNTSRQFATMHDDQIAGLDMLRERGQLTVQQVGQMSNVLAMGAKASNISVKEAGDVLGSVMTNLKIAPKDAERVWDVLVKGANDFQLNIGEVARGAPRLTAVMKSLGFEGVAGLTKMTAILSQVRPEFNSTADAMTAVTTLFNDLANPQLAAAIGRTPRGLNRELAAVKAQGGDTIELFSRWVQMAMRGGSQLEDIFEKRSLPAVRALAGDIKGLTRIMDDLTKANGEAKRASDIATKGPLEDWQRLKTELAAASVELGKIITSLNNFGGGQSSTGKLLNYLTSIVERLEKLNEVAEKGWSGSQLQQEMQRNRAETWRRGGPSIGPGGLETLQREVEQAKPGTDRRRIREERLRKFIERLGDPRLPLPEMPTEVPPELRRGTGTRRLQLPDETIQGNENTNDIKGNAAGDDLSSIDSTTGQQLGEQRAMRASLTNMERYMSDLWSDKRGGAAYLRSSQENLDNWARARGAAEGAGASAGVSGGGAAGAAGAFFGGRGGGGPSGGGGEPAGTPGAGVGRPGRAPMGSAGSGAGAGGGPATRADRNNNPGNIKFGPFAQRMGATHADSGGFAVFPDRETGFKAAESLLGSRGYAGKTLREIGSRWANGDPNWASTVSKATGIPLDAVPTPEQRAQIARTGIPRAEGTSIGQGGAPSAPGGASSAPGGAPQVGPPGTVPPTGATPGVSAPYHIGGQITMDGQTYRYGSGGAGRGATPPGSYPVNIGRGDIGRIGQQIGSIATVGRPGGVINDPRYPGAPRGGIQIHASTGSRLDKLYSQGCFAIDRRQWPAFKRHLLELDRRTPGGLRIDVDKNGRAQIVARNAPIVTDGTPIGATPAPRGTAADTAPEPVQGPRAEGANEEAAARGQGSPAAAAPGGGAPAAFSGSDRSDMRDAAPVLPSQSDGFNVAPGSSMLGAGGARPSADNGALDQARMIRAELSEPITLRTRLDASHHQFQRASVRRDVDRETREAMNNNWGDSVGAA